MAQQRSTMRWDSARAERVILDATARGLRIWAEYVLQQSTDLVPLDEGPLQHSGVASVDAANLEAAVSYDTPYAVEQHENLAYGHAPGRTAKYLEKPWLQSRTVALALIQKQIRQITK